MVEVNQYQKYRELKNKLDTVHKFPCSYTVKIIGLNSNNFAKTILTYLEKKILNLEILTNKSKISNNAKYISISTEIFAVNSEQILQIYKELQKHELVLMSI